MRKLALEIIWFDDDMLELRVCASNGRFSGQATFYAALDEPARFAAKIEGFPLSASDSRDYKLGGGKFVECGSATARLACKDGCGHLLVEITICMPSGDENSAVESSTLLVEALPAEIDSFVEQLRLMRVEVGQIAVLGQIS